jgi:hypothetical protein
MYEVAIRHLEWTDIDEEVLENWKDAIEFAGGSTMRAPTWRASCRCFTGCPPRDIPKVVSFG